MSQIQAAEFKIKADVLMPLTLRRDGPAALRIVLHLAAIVVVGGGLAASRGTLWIVPLTFLLGYLVAFLFNAEHETAHQTAFRQRVLNQVVGQLWRLRCTAAL